MPEIQGNTDNFLKAIEKYAEEQRTKIRFESETYKKEELEKAEAEGLREAYALIQREMSAIRDKISSKLSRDELESKTHLFEKRNKMSEEVFKKAAQKLIAFTKTSEYEAMMLNSVREIAKVLKADDIVFFVKNDDLRFAEKIKSAFSASCEIKTSKEIKIGGIMGRSASLGLIADETLDTKLDGQREWFYENSGLKVTQ